MKELLKSSIAAACILITGSLVTSAADLPPRPTPMPATAMVPVYNWTGIYLGINGGYAFGKQDPLSLISDNYSAFNYSANGWLAGGTFGAQIQSGHVVMGLEGDIDWTNIKGSGTGPVSLLRYFRNWNPFIQRFIHKHFKGAGWLRIRQLAVLRNCRRCCDKSVVQFHPRRWHSLQHWHDTLLYFKIRPAPGSRCRRWR